ncbi:hypothetical protein TNCV_3529811 [Trichonephila clavipes]|uniref:Uncharacterized protein n=1 Tax=Trichonephila clavipes TaxID=2585209 RepID=A0A8X6RM56_TRICX|nr:hypothetical protein TNCV_3529811 [Trichonephila clavipes]
MVLKANDRRTSCPCHDEFRGPRSDYVRQVALATTTTYHFVLSISAICETESLGPEWHYFNPTLSRRNRDMQISE